VLSDGPYPVPVDGVLGLVGAAAIDGLMKASPATRAMPTVLIFMLGRVDGGQGSESRGRTGAALGLSGLFTERGLVAKNFGSFIGERPRRRKWGGEREGEKETTRETSESDHC
jgi:hypothetical protein